MPLTLRSTKGSALTYEELDANFQGLANGAFLETTIAGTYEFDQVNANIGMASPLVQTTTLETTTVDATTVNADVVNASGAIVQQKFDRIGPGRLTVTSINPVAIPGFNIVISPKYADSIIEVSVTLNTTSTYVSSFAIYKDGSPTVSTTGQTNNNQPDMQATLFQNHGTDNLTQINLYHYQVAGNTSAQVFSVYATSGWNGSLYTLHINNRNSNDMAGFSYMTVKEIRP